MKEQIGQVCHLSPENEEYSVGPARRKNSLKGFPSGPTGSNASPKIKRAREGSSAFRFFPLAIRNPDGFICTLGFLYTVRFSSQPFPRGNQLNECIVFSHLKAIDEENKFLKIKSTFVTFIVNLKLYKCIQVSFFYKNIWIYLATFFKILN